MGVTKKCPFPLLKISNALINNHINLAQTHLETKWNCPCTSTLHLTIPPLPTPEKPKRKNRAGEGGEIADGRGFGFRSYGGLSGGGAHTHQSQQKEAGPRPRPFNSREYY